MDENNQDTIKEVNWQMEQDEASSDSTALDEIHERMKSKALEQPAVISEEGLNAISDEKAQAAFALVLERLKTVEIEVLRISSRIPCIEKSMEDLTGIISAHVKELHTMIIEGQTTQFKKSSIKKKPGRKWARGYSRREEEMYAELGEVWEKKMDCKQKEFVRFGNLAIFKKYQKWLGDWQDPKEAKKSGTLDKIDADIRGAINGEECYSMNEFLTILLEEADRFECDVSEELRREITGEIVDLTPEEEAQIELDLEGPEEIECSSEHSSEEDVEDHSSEDEEEEEEEDDDRPF